MAGRSIRLASAILRMDRMLRAALLFFALAALVALFGCSPWSPVSPSGTPQEEFVLSETLRFAKILNVKVHGELTDSIYWVDASNPAYIGEKVYAAGWYQNGVCYYYRPWLVKQEMATMTYIAAHEVCHAIYNNHSLQHGQCTQNLIGGRL